MGLLCALLLERELVNYPFGSVPHAPEPNATGGAGAGLGGGAALGGESLSLLQLLVYLVAVAGLVFVLLLAEFGLVRSLVS